MKKQNTTWSEEESLRRSHSGVSNFKLTLVCLLCAFSVTGFVAALATVGTGLISGGLLTVFLIGTGVLAALSLWLISRFKR
ncbi:MAG: hypothetical protein KBS76_00650 [Ruminococcus sp.]|nr:hypothetical protein [Candidatus Apopatosoma intestinale]